MAIIEDNANEDMKALKFCTDSILEEIDNTSEAIKKAVDTIIGGTNHQNELDGIVEQRVTEFQKMKNKITRLKGSVYPRIVASSYKGYICLYIVRICWGIRFLEKHPRLIQGSFSG